MIDPANRAVRWALVLLLTGPAVPGAWAAPDEDSLGKALGYPPGTRATVNREPHLVWSHSGGQEQVYPYHLVRKGDAVAPLVRAEREWRFRYVLDGRRYDSDDYLQRQRVTGLLVAKDGRILLERYQYDRNDAHRFQSHSMAKSVVSLLVGVALAEGRIAAIDDPVKRYVPELAGHPYGETPIRNLLQMSSGVRFSEDYTGTDDVAVLSRAVRDERGAGGVATVRPFRDHPRLHPSGTRFAYASVETQVLGLVLRGAIGRPLADYLSEKIWQPMGAEADASWMVDAGGQEAAFCCLGAVLRDYARLGFLIANDGAAQGRQIVPPDWVREATGPTPGYPHLEPGTATRYFGYGYQFWVFPGGARRFALLGVRGQAVFVDPALKLVMVQTAVWKAARDAEAARERDALWRGIVAEFGRW